MEEEYGVKRRLKVPVVVVVDEWKLIIDAVDFKAATTYTRVGEPPTELRL